MIELLSMLQFKATDPSGQVTSIIINATFCPQQYENTNYDNTAEEIT